MAAKDISQCAGEKFERFVATVSESLLGYDRASKALFIATVLNKHILLEGLPGVGKTSLVKLFSTLTDLDFKRVQCTPDLLPTDILGGTIYDQRARKFSIRYGPIFTNVLLLDEINRASPKTQSALLEAMEEKQVTIEGKSYVLDVPFIVIATQNPIEQEGTYPLPEAQLDRFLFKLDIAYPSKDDEFKILKIKKNKHSTIFVKDEIRALKSMIDYVYASDSILAYVVEIISELRNNPQVSWGPSSRATIALIDAAKICAMLGGRMYVVPDDVLEFSVEILAHRLGLKSEYELEGVRKESVIQDILEAVDAE